MSNTQISPISKSERLEIIDVLRGLAVAGILIGNMQWFSGYGMMLAEIGLPPGADVDRASLENGMKNSGWAFNQYDVLPDRVVVYLWPRAGGVAFDFKFRPRFGLTAKAAPSVVYDYYNPEARAVVAPVMFVVK